MRAVKSTATKPELAFLTEIAKLGMRPKRNVAYLPGKPDFVFSRKRLAIFLMVISGTAISGCAENLGTYGVCPRFDFVRNFHCNLLGVAHFLEDLVLESIIPMPQVGRNQAL